jgi:acetyl-CoA acetyltransferase
MSNKPSIAGVGMVPFTKPGRGDPWDVMAASAARLALQDAGIDYNDYVGFVYNDSTAGQSALYQVGLTGIPIVNVNNNCATGSTALFLARQAVEAGIVDVALALGFEEMKPGALDLVYKDKKPVMGMHQSAMELLQDSDPLAPGPSMYFGGAGREHQQKYGTETETFAKISVKARKHAANNPFAIFRDPLSLHDVLQSPHLYGPLTRYQACPPTCGAAAAVIVSPAFAKKKGPHRVCRVRCAIAANAPVSVRESLKVGRVAHKPRTRRFASFQRRFLRRSWRRKMQGRDRVPFWKSASRPGSAARFCAGFVGLVSAGDLYESRTMPLPIGQPRDTEPDTPTVGDPYGTDTI